MMAPMVANVEAPAQTHTITALVQNHPGVLARVTGLFARRGYNIESLAVSITENPEVSRMTFVVSGDTQVLEQITKQLNKLIEVMKVVDYTDTAAIERELAMVKVSADDRTRGSIKEIAEIFRARIIDICERTLTMEVTGSTDKIDALTKLLAGFGIREVVRTGVIALARGSKTV